uniref:Uncharacterized protein n=1 Tax=Anguilla anguilla TaxID=7936 RepID=A0A0E9W7K0_ANGAN
MSNYCIYFDCNLMLRGEARCVEVQADNTVPNY